jgi:hypothetical protein
MGQRRDRFDEREGSGRSGFAQRGESTEERMSQDDSRYQFQGDPRGNDRGARPGNARGYDRGEPVGYVEQRGEGYRERATRASSTDPRGYYGSGGSYGYGGSFEHGGKPGYEGPDGPTPVHPGEQFYEATGGFGRDTNAYGRHGLGYPGQEEQRWGHPGQQRELSREAGRLERGGYRQEDDARRGYSQESGYAQSGGNRVGPEGSGYGSSRDHADQFGHEGGGRRSQRAPTPYQARPQGRAPRGYARSDERIHEDVCDRLSHGDVDPSEVTVTVSQGIVTLEGTVESRDEKFQLEHVAAAALGVKDVENRLRLRGRGQQQAAAPQQAAAAQEPTATAKVRAGNNENGARG